MAAWLDELVPPVGDEIWSAGACSALGRRGAVRRSPPHPAHPKAAASCRTPAAPIRAQSGRWCALAYPDAVFDPPLAEPLALQSRPGGRADAHAALLEIVRGWMDSSGRRRPRRWPRGSGCRSRRSTARCCSSKPTAASCAGTFTAGAGDAMEWCERGLLSRIHRLTLGRLRREIEAVSPADFFRFLLAWQHVQPGTQLHGRDGVRQVIAQLQGLELPGPAWERDVLPARIAEYDPRDLEQLCLAGEVAWGRLAVASAAEGETRPSSRRAQAPRRADARRAAGVRAARRSARAARAAPDEAQVLRRALAGCARGARLPRSSAARRSWPTSRARSAPADRGRGRAVGAGGIGPGHRRRHRRPAHAAAAGARAAAAPRRHLRALPGGAARRLMPVGRWALLRDQAEVAAARRGRGRARRAAPVAALGRGVPRALRARARRCRAGARCCWRCAAWRRAARFAAAASSTASSANSSRCPKRSTRCAACAAAAHAASGAWSPPPIRSISSASSPQGARVSPFSGQVIAYRDGVPIEIGELGAVRSRLQRASS